VTVVNIVNVPVLVHSKPRPIFRPNAKPARTRATDAVGPTGPAQSLGVPFAVLRMSGYKWDGDIVGIRKVCGDRPEAVN
jgi:hypothetical protein